MMENVVLPLEIAWGVWKKRARKSLESSESDMSGSSGQVE
jgi:hypothetical protein